jgi:RNA-directed DNA polymerase
VVPRIHQRSGTELKDIAAWVKPVVRGWMAYYGRFCRTALNSLLQHFNTYLVRWAKRKYKRLRTFKKVRKWWEGLTARQPRLFAHWAAFVVVGRPDPGIDLAVPGGPVFLEWGL